MSIGCEKIVDTGGSGQESRLRRKMVAKAFNGCSADQEEKEEAQEQKEEQQRQQQQEQEEE